jgi:hypothetical protein
LLLPVYFVVVENRLLEICGLPLFAKNPGFPVELGCSGKLPAAFLKRKPHS